MISDNVNAPYANANGFTLSDGSTSILLEDMESAKERNAKVYAKVTGYGMAHKSVEFNTIKDSNSALISSINAALADANIDLSKIDAVVGFANGDKDIDNEESIALNKVFGDKLNKLPIINIKENLGEGRSATAALEATHAALLLAGELKEANAYVNNKKTVVSANTLNKILVISYGFGGSYTAIVVEK